MQMLKKIFRFPFFGVLVGFLPLISLWNFNKTQIYTRDVYLSLIITVVFVSLIWLGLKLIFRSSLRASIAASLLFLLFFSYGHVYNLVKDWTVIGVTLGYKKLLLVYLIFFLIIGYVSLRTRFIPQYLVVILNGMLSFLILFNLAQIAIYAASVSSSRVQRELPEESDASPLIVSDEYPDIYYIILDSYSRQDILQEYMNYDNSGFTDSLEELGFYVADCSNSNFSDTLGSVVTSLNYSFFKARKTSTGDNVKASPLELRKNKMRVFLKKYGYKFVTTRGYSTETDIQNSDIYLNYLKDQGIKDTIGQSEFTRLYFETTLLRVFFEMYYMNPVKNDFLPQWLFISGKDQSVLGYASFWYNQTMYVFDSLDEIPEKDGNYFVYAHINAPHGPYVFDRYGNFSYTHNPKDNVPYYVDELIYVNKRILQLVKALISKSSSPPIIIIQGDHGAHVITTGLDKHKILNAYYFPAQAQAALYESITPVNTFRVLLREYFNQDIKLLPDTMFVKLTDGIKEMVSSCELK